MSLLELVIVLVVGGLCWYLLERYVPLPDPIKLMLRVLLVLVLILLILAFFKVITLPFSLT